MSAPRPARQTTATIDEATYRRLSQPVNLAEIRQQLSPERRDCADAMRLYMTLTSLVREAYAERNKDRERRLTRARQHAAARLERKYNKLSPRPALPLGNIYAPAVKKTIRKNAAETTNTTAAAPAPHVIAAASSQQPAQRRAA